MQLQVELEQQDLQHNYRRSGIMCGLCPSGVKYDVGDILIEMKCVPCNFVV